MRGAPDGAPRFFPSSILPTRPRAAGDLVKALVHASLAVLAGCATGGARTAEPAVTVNRAGYASVHGLRMYYEEHGTGRPLVLLHGGGSTVQTSFGDVDDQSP